MIEQEKDMCHLGIRIERDTFYRLAQCAIQEERNMSQVCRLALRRYLDEKDAKKNDE